MKVKVIESKNTEDTVIVVNGVIGFIKQKGFERPAVGTELDVMVIGVKLNPSDDSKAVLFCRPIENDDVLIEHNGFEISGVNGRTTSKPVVPEEFQFMLTPGLTGVYVARNSEKVRPDWKDSPEALRPGKIFIKDEVLKKNGFVRAEGVDSIEDLDFWVRRAKVQGKKPRKKQKDNDRTVKLIKTEPPTKAQLDDLVNKFKKL